VAVWPYFKLTHTVILLIIVCLHILPNPFSGNELFACAKFKWIHYRVCLSQALIVYLMAFPPLTLSHQHLAAVFGRLSLGIGNICPIFPWLVWYMISFLLTTKIHTHTHAVRYSACIVPETNTIYIPFDRIYQMKVDGNEEVNETPKKDCISRKRFNISERKCGQKVKSDFALREWIEYGECSESEIHLSVPLSYSQHTHTHIDFWSSKDLSSGNVIVFSIPLRDNNNKKSGSVSKEIHTKAGNGIQLNSQAGRDCCWIKSISLHTHTFLFPELFREKPLLSKFTLRRREQYVQPPVVIILIMSSMPVYAFTHPEVWIMHCTKTYVPLVISLSIAGHKVCCQHKQRNSLWVVS